MVSMVFVHVRGSLFDIYGLLHFPLVPVRFMESGIFAVIHGPPPSSVKRPPSNNNNPCQSMLGLLYVAGLSEQLGQVYKSHSVNMYHKSANILRSMVVHLKNKTPKNTNVEPSPTSRVTTTAAIHTLAKQRDHSVRG